MIMINAVRTFIRRTRWRVLRAWRWLDDRLPGSAWRTYTMTWTPSETIKLRSLTVASGGCRVQLSVEDQRVLAAAVTWPPTTFELYFAHQPFSGGVIVRADQRVIVTIKAHCDDEAIDPDQLCFLSYRLLASQPFNEKAFVSPVWIDAPLAQTVPLAAPRDPGWRWDV